VGFGLNFHLPYTEVVESADFTFLMNQTDLTWGNLSSHLSKLEEAGYVQIDKEFVDKKPHTMLSLTETGRADFQHYRQQVERFIQGLPTMPKGPYKSPG
jgi:DNA-binding MarR family transcriptional regulator